MTVLEDEAFVSAITKELKELLAAQPTSLAAEWEEFKQRAKMTAMERRSILKRNQNQIERNLRKQLELLIIIENVQPGTFIKELRDVKSQLEGIDTEKYKAAITSARTEKLWAGERPTKRALSNEKR